MPCLRPLDGWRSPDGGPISFRLSRGYADQPVKVPCGQCRACRLEYSRQWAMRCVHETRMHDENCFVTLTYDDDHLPEYGSLDVSEYQLFIKRLRKHVEPKKIRFFGCGEYGSVNHRPHYHFLIFGHNFDDRVKWSVNAQGDIVYTSPSLADLWPLGFSSLGAATFESAAYVARYIMKKQKGDMAVKYGVLDYRTGRIVARKKEFMTCSRDPAIGVSWFRKYKKQVIDNDFVVMRGKEMSIPRAYDRVMEKENESEIRKIKGQRKRDAKAHAWNNTSSRHLVREKVLESRIQLLERKL